MIYLFLITVHPNQIFATAEEKQIGRDLGLYNFVLQAYAHKGDIESMFKTLTNMKENGFAPNVVVYTSLMTIFR